MHISQEKHDEVIVVAPQGRIDSTTSAAFDAHLSGLPKTGQPRIVIDFAEVDYISSAGLRVMLTLAKRVRDARGALALFNFHWLGASVRSAFGGAPGGARPKLGASRYVLRYFVVAAAVAAAAALNLVSVVAALAGMCAFVPAALAEGFRQLYFSFTAREDT